MGKQVREAIGAIILETEEETDAMFVYLLKLEEAAQAIPRENLEWVMPTSSGLKWRTKDGTTHCKDLR